MYEIRLILPGCKEMGIETPRGYPYSLDRPVHSRIKYSVPKATYVRTHSQGLE